MILVWKYKAKVCMSVCMEKLNREILRRYSKSKFISETTLKVKKHDFMFCGRGYFYTNL